MLKKKGVSMLKKSPWICLYFISASNIKVKRLKKKQTTNVSSSEEDIDIQHLCNDNNDDDIVDMEV